MLKVWGEELKTIGILLQENKGSNTIRYGLEKTETVGRDDSLIIELGKHKDLNWASE